MSEYIPVTDRMQERKDRTFYWEKFEEGIVRDDWGYCAYMNTMLDVLEKISDRLDSIEELLRNGARK